MKEKAGYLKSHYQKPTEEEKLALCKRWQASGLSQKAFCEQNGVAKSSLYKWHKKFCLNAESTLPGFARLNTVSEQSTQEKVSMELKLPNGAILQLSLSSNDVFALIQDLSHAATIVR
jgi:hypothetical protein